MPDRRPSMPTRPTMSRGTDANLRARSNERHGTTEVPRTNMLDRIECRPVSVPGSDPAIATRTAIPTATAMAHPRK